MAQRQAALLCHIFERHTTIEIGAENFLGAALLPRREAATNGPRYRPQPTVGLSQVNPGRQRDVIDK